MRTLNAWWVLSFLSHPIDRPKDLFVYFLKMCLPSVLSAYRDKRDKRDRIPETLSWLALWKDGKEALCHLERTEEE